MIEHEHNALIRVEKHPNIIKSFSTNAEGTLKYGDRTESIKYSVLEHAANGVFSNYIMTSGPLEEEIARFFAIQLWSAVDFIHSQHYAHLDLKLENILFDEYFNIKVADMGSSLDVSNTQGMAYKRRGTYVYMAPEVANFVQGQKYNASAADVYSLGITLFVMLIGEFPAFSEWDKMITNDTELSPPVYEASPLQRVCQERWESLSSEARNLIQGMTHPDPQKRLTLKQVQKSAWLCTPFSSNIWEAVYHEMKTRKQFISN